MAADYATARAPGRGETTEGYSSPEAERSRQSTAAPAAETTSSDAPPTTDRLRQRGSGSGSLRLRIRRAMSIVAQPTTAFRRFMTAMERLYRSASGPGRSPTTRCYSRHGDVRGHAGFDVAIAGHTAGTQ